MEFSRVRSRRVLPTAIALALAIPTGTHAATVTVNSADDVAASTFCNLRDALASIDNGNTASTPTCASTTTGAFRSNDSIAFDASLVDAKITLTQGSLSVGFLREVTIAGSGQTIDAAGQSRVLQLSQYARVTASNLKFTGGKALYGGGIDVSWYAGLTLNNCTVSNNTADHGGGISVSPFAGLALNGSTVSVNTANGAGGGIYAKGLLTLNTSTISNNTSNCPSNNSCGGGIHVEGGPLSIVTVLDSTIAGNTVYGSGGHLAGGVYLRNSYGTFINSTITANSAQGDDYLSGGLWQVGRLVTLINSTLVSNHASRYAGGTHVSGGVASGVMPYGGTGKLTLANTIVSGNFGNVPANSDVLIGADTTTVNTHYNLFGSTLNRTPFNAAANHNLFNDTLGLGPLQNNGGPTLTMAPAPTSPAHGAGSVALAVYSGAPINYDQRGFAYPRTIDHSIDIGAFQYQGDRIFADGLEPKP